ncbi:MAG TPA: YbbR-like domain-containing protein [Bacteroidaceae bacterium]|nr:YbbR-like domain-containing protein [Bacteroidaceae bacterium]
MMYWLLQTFNQSGEATFTFPVVLEGVPEEVYIVDSLPKTLRVTLTDKKYRLLNYRWEDHPDTIRFHYASLLQTTGTFTYSSDVVEKHIQSHVSSSSEIQQYHPQILQYQYSSGLRTRVAVKFRGKVSADKMYQVTDTILSPDSVEVVAPADIADSLKTIYTQFTTINNLRDTTTFTIRLSKSRQVKLLQHTVQATFPVEMYIRKTYDVELQGINFPLDLCLRSFPGTVQVACKMSVATAKRVKSDDFVLGADYHSLMRDSLETRYPVQVFSYPKDLQIVDVFPSEVDYVYEKKYVE